VPMGEAQRFSAARPPPGRHRCRRMQLTSIAGIGIVISFSTALASSCTGRTSAAAARATPVRRHWRATRTPTRARRATIPRDPTPFATTRSLRRRVTAAAERLLEPARPRWPRDRCRTAPPSATIRQNPQNFRQPLRAFNIARLPVAICRWLGSSSLRREARINSAAVRQDRHRLHIDQHIDSISTVGGPPSTPSRRTAPGQAQREFALDSSSKVVPEQPARDRIDVGVEEKQTVVRTNTLSSHIWPSSSSFRLVIGAMNGFGSRTEALRQITVMPGAFMFTTQVTRWPFRSQALLRRYRRPRHTPAGDIPTLPLR